MNMQSPKDLATKAFYAAVGAPVVFGRRMLQYRESLAEYGEKMSNLAQARFDAAATEGENIAQRLKERGVVEELQRRVDLDKVEKRMEEFRDRLESALQSWRESTTAGEATEAASKTTAKKTPAKTTAKNTPAKTTAKNTAAKKTPAGAGGK